MLGILDVARVVAAADCVLANDLAFSRAVVSAHDRELTAAGVLKIGPGLGPGFRLGVVNACGFGRVVALVHPLAIGTLKDGSVVGIAHDEIIGSVGGTELVERVDEPSASTKPA